MAKKVAVIIGSLRKDSITRKIALELMKLAPPTITMEIVEIGDLPIYNQDLDDNPPQAWLKFREQLKKAEGILFATPEYNRSVPAPLKNAIDVGSRPYGQSAWSGKPGAIITGAPGSVGGFGANHHLRQSLVFLDVFCMQQPEAYIPNFATLFAEDGGITRPETQEFLKNFIDAFAKWVNIKWN